MYGIKVQHYGEQPQVMAHHPANREDALRYIRQQLAIAQIDGQSTGEVAGRFVVFGEEGIFQTQFWPVQITERPIIFHPQLIPGVMTGLITETRRVFKAQPDGFFGGFDGKVAHFYSAVGRQTFKPRYLPDDLLWVKEAWATFPEYDHLTPSQLSHGDGDAPVPVFYRADGDDSRVERWRSPLFLPRQFSRVAVTVVTVDAQRVQSITPAQVIASGLDSTPAYRELWDNLNKKRGFGWDANPWTWVYKIQLLNI